MLETLKRVFVYARPYLRFFLMTLLFAALGVSMSLAVPVFIGEAVDCCVGKGSVDFEKLVKIIILLALTVIFSTFFQWLMSLCTNKLAFLTIRDLRADVFNKLERVPLKYIDGHTKGELTSRVINDIEIVSDGLLQGFTQFFSGIMTIIGTLIFMMMINYKIAIVVVILTPLSFIAASKITKASHDSYMKQSKLRGDMVAFAEEMAGNQKIVKAFGYDKRAEEKFDEINNAYGKIGVKATFFSSMTNPTTRFVNGLIYASVGLLGALGVIGYSTFIGTMTVGKLSSFLAYANQYTKPFNEISGVFAELQNAVSSAERVFSILDEEEIADDSDKEILTSCDGTLSFSNVFFSSISLYSLLSTTFIDSRFCDEIKRKFKASRQNNFLFKLYATNTHGDTISRLYKFPIDDIDGVTVDNDKYGIIVNFNGDTATFIQSLTAILYNDNTRITNLSQIKLKLETVFCLVHETDYLYQDEALIDKLNEFTGLIFETQVDGDDMFINPETEDDIYFIPENI